MEGVQDKRETAIKDSYDVIVVGGGIGGVAAGVSAARCGAKTLIVEKHVNLGGLATTGLISWYEPLCDGEGRQMVGGIAEELIRLSIKYGFETLSEEWGGSRRGRSGYKRFATRFSPTLFALALDEYCLQNGVDLLFDTLVTYPVMEGNICCGIVVENVSGKEFYGAKVVVDATGTATVMERAGVPTAVGENYLSYVVHTISKKAVEACAKEWDMNALRIWKNSGSDLWGNGHPEGMPMLYGVTGEDVTRFVIEGKRRMLEKYKSDNKEERDILALPYMPQFRKIRRIKGDYEFDGSEEGKKFENSVGSFADFRAAGRRFELPYSCLYSSAFPNLLACGRIISAKDDGWELTRVIPICALSGQAAGAAAAQSIREGVPVGGIDVKELQKTLGAAGVLFL
ncbi:MAG: FAD-dependent oxidoreductase [Eubacteriales bacterium]|jgi:hypothetical protein|nr:FAD-dependent oxidoreductase [Clostridiales bacterium]